LIMITGISYGASVVTPPGIQVVGGATNNNVMVYSDGALIDSGVAPTNLVSVTNLTADIEALSATNAAQDALIAGNLYAEGTTNKTLIDAAINGLVIKVSSTGVKTTYTPSADTDEARGIALESATDTASDGDTFIISKGNYLWPDTAFAVDDNRILAEGTNNVSFIGIGKPLIYGYDEDVVQQHALVNFSNCDNILWDGIDVQLICSNSVTNALVYNYAFIATGSQSAYIQNCIIQMETHGSGHTGDKTFVAVNGATNVICRNVNIVTLDKGTNTIFHIAEHDAGDTTFIDCAFIGNPTDDRFSVAFQLPQIFIGDNKSTVLFDPDYCSDPKAFRLIGRDQGTAYMIPGTESLLTDAMCDYANIPARPIDIFQYLDYAANRIKPELNVDQWKVDVTSGSGTYVTTSTAFDISSGATANSYQTFVWPKGWAILPYSKPVVYDRIDWSKRIVLDGWFIIDTAGAGTKARFVLGQGNSYISALTYESIGLTVSNLSVSVQVRNTSATTDSGTICTIAQADRPAYFRLDSFGDGNVNYVIRVDGAEYSGTVTGGPTTQGTQFTHRLGIIAENDASGNTMDLIVNNLAIQTIP